MPPSHASGTAHELSEAGPALGTVATWTLKVSSSCGDMSETPLNPLGSGTWNGLAGNPTGPEDIGEG